MKENRALRLYALEQLCFVYATQWLVGGALYVALLGKNLLAVPDALVGWVCWGFGAFTVGLGVHAAITWKGWLTSEVVQQRLLKHMQLERVFRKP